MLLELGGKMKSKNKALRLWRGGAVLCSMMTVISVGASYIANQWAVMIDRTLGTTSSRIENDEGNSEDLYLFKNDQIKSSADLVNWHKDLAERESEEGSVLLKNESDSLPLTSGAKITLLGMRSHYPQYGGQIGSSPNADQNVSLESALTKKGFQVNPTSISAYEKLGNIQTGTTTSWGQEVPEYGYRPGTLKNSFGVSAGIIGKLKIGEPSIAQLKETESELENSFSDYKDAAIVVIGRPSSEAADFYPGEEGMENPSEFEKGANVLGLTINEKALVDYACDKFDNVVVLINSNSAMEIDYLKKKDGVKSIMWVGEPGNYGFLGVADLLKGAVSPSGHLPDTYAVNSTSSPAMANYGYIGYSNYESFTKGDMKYSDYRAISYLDESEGIYTGYKYYETRYEDAYLNRYEATSLAGSSTGAAWNYDDEVSYTFGYGLSYSEFEQTLGTIDTEGDNETISVEVKVKNTGSAKAKDVVQVYVQTPYTSYDIENNVEKSSIQLAGFEKTKELNPQEETTVTVTIDKKYIASYDYTKAKTYILDEGNYYLSLGNGAHEALQNVLAKKASATFGDAEKVYEWHENFDAKTFSKSDNGTRITNRFDDMNLDYWTGKKNSRLTRSNWSSSWPTKNENLTATEAMITELRNEIYEFATDDDVSDIKWNANNGTKIASMKGASYKDERWEFLLDNLSLEDAINIYVTGNSQVSEAKSIGLVKLNVQDGPLGFCYGSLGKFSNPDSPTYAGGNDENANYSTYDSVTEPVIAATFNKELVNEQGRLFGTDSLWNNSTILWGPGLNLHRTPYNGRNHEYYSEDAMLTNLLGAEIVSGGKQYGCIISPKHFAFNDQETNRCGVSVFMNEQKAREGELRAFQGAFEDAGCLGTMTAFNRAGVRYASAHKGLMTEVLKNEWGFSGYAVTDMINGDKYMRADTALLAGTTILDTTKSNWFTVEAIKKDATMQKALREAMHANLFAIANSNGLNGMNAFSRVIYEMTWWKASLIALYVSFSVLTAGTLIGYAVVSVRSKKEKEEK